MRRLPGNLRNVYGKPCIRQHGQRPRYEGYSSINVYISKNTFVQVDEQNYVLSANEDVEMLDVENEDEEDEVESELDPDEGRFQAQRVFYILNQIRRS